MDTICSCVSCWKDHNLIDAVEKLRTQVTLQRFHDRLSDALVLRWRWSVRRPSPMGCRPKLTGAEVAGHDDDGVAKVQRYGRGRRSRRPSSKHLEQDIEHFRMVRFLDFVEQNHTIRPATYCLGELTTTGLFEANISREAHR